MGTHASAEVFYGIAWPSEELPEKWDKAREARWDAGDFDTEDEDSSERLEKLLKELEVDQLLEVDVHGGLVYDVCGYAVSVKGSKVKVGCGEVERLVGPPGVSTGAMAALQKVILSLGAGNAQVGWLVTVTYG
jgi:hypothetical protein